MGQLEEQIRAEREEFNLLVVSLIRLFDSFVDFVFKDLVPKKVRISSSKLTLVLLDVLHNESGFSFRQVLQRKKREEAYLAPFDKSPQTKNGSVGSSFFKVGILDRISSISESDTSSVGTELDERVSKGERVSS